MNNTPNLSPAERLGILIEFLIQAILARAGLRLPRWMIEMITGQLRGIGEAFAVLAAKVAESKLAEQGQPAPPLAAPVAPRRQSNSTQPRRECRTRNSRKMPQKLPLPLWGQAAKQTDAGERGYSARKPERQKPLTYFSPTRGDGLKVARSPPPIPVWKKPASWHARIVPISK